MKVKKASTDITTYFKLVDPSTGDEETGLTITDLDMSYIRYRAEAVKADATTLTAADDAHSDNKMFEVDSTNCPGIYRADWPDAAFASGVDKVQLIIKGSAIDTAVMEVELWDKLPNDLSTEIGALNDLSSADVNAACDTALADYDAVTDTQATANKDSIETNIAALNDVSAAEVNAQCDQALFDYAPPTRVEATADKDEILTDIAGLNDVSTADVNAQCDLAIADFAPSTRVQDIADALAIVTEIDENEAKLDTVIAKTNLIPGSPAAVGSAMTLAADAVDTAALKTDAVTEIVTAIFAKTGLTAGGAATYDTISKAIYGAVRGKIAKSGDAYTFYDDDDTTPLFVLTLASAERTVA